MEKKSFVFYTSWNEAIKQMDEQQLRRFITNLCNYAEGADVHLDGVVDQIMWSQVKPLLDYNEGKRQKRIESGKKGGLAKASILQDAKQNVANSSILEDAKQSEVDSSMLSVEGRRMKDDGRRMKVEGRGMMDEGKKVEGKKVDVEGKMVDVDMIKVIEKYNTSGWNSLSPKECSIMYKVKELNIDYEKK
jgi:hypothetical protein